METAGQTGQNRNSTAMLLGRLSIGVFSVSMVGDTQWATVMLIVFGAILALSGIYLIMPSYFGQEKFLRKVATRHTIYLLETLGWLIVLALFGIRLIQMGRATGSHWLTLIGICFAISSYVVFQIGMWKSSKIEE